MARLSYLSLFLAYLFVATNANPFSFQKPIVNQDRPVHATANWDWRSCGSASDAIQIESITVSPDPPKPGHDLTVTVKASAQEEIEEGAYADVTVKLGVVKLLTKEFDLCEEARNAELEVQCPVKEGNYLVEHTVTLPKEIPQAKFNVNAHGYTVDDEELFCVDLTINFFKKPFLKLFLG
ncbi:ML domain-containing protein [Lactifluus volemus]|nr:ML domain-containing protein [Lactifluus volemus]